MNPERALLLLLTVPLLCGMRDPFAPVMDGCRTAQLADWHYRGGTQSASRLIGVVQERDEGWRRVEVGQALNAGWRVTEVTLDSLTVETGEGCEPRVWQWKREGTLNDKKDRAVDAGAGVSVGSSEKRHPGGG